MVLFYPKADLLLSCNAIFIDGFLRKSFLQAQLVVAFLNYYYQRTTVNRQMEPIPKQTF